jgi:hypothetical protein
MAVSITFLRADAYRMFYAISHDGAAGDTASRTNAQLLADAASSPRIQEVLRTAVDNDAEAVLLMMAGGKAVTHITPGTAAAGWAVDWSEDGSNLAELEVEGEAGTANDGILEIQVLHSYNK